MVDLNKIIKDLQVKKLACPTTTAESRARRGAYVDAIMIINRYIQNQVFCVCQNRQDQYNIRGVWICGDCEMNIEQKK